MMAISNRTRIAISMVMVVIVVFLIAGCSSKKGDVQKAENTGVPQTESRSPESAGVTNPGDRGLEKLSNQPKTGGILRIGIVKEISTLNPQVDTRSADYDVRVLMFESLLLPAKNREPKPGLAERWITSSDGKEYTFYLRKGVKFHNGKTMTARDIKWTTDYVMDKNNAAYGYTAFDNIESVTIVDDYAIKMTLKKAQSEDVFLANFTGIDAFAVVPEGSLGSGKDKPISYPPGTGPFKFEEYKPGQHVSTVRYQDYWGQVPYLDKVIIKWVPDDNVRFAALRAGDLDLIEEAPLQWAEKIKKGELKGFTYSEIKTGGFRRITFDVKRSPYDNVKVRQAVAYAIDKQQYADSILWGFGTPTNQRMGPDSSWLVNMPDRKRDVQKAKQLLEEAGYGNGLEIKLQGRQGMEGEAQLFQNQLAEAGIKVKIDIVEAARYTSSQRDGDFEVTLKGAALQVDPSTILSADYITEPGIGGKRASNISGYSNQEVDQLLRALNEELDHQKRKEIYKQVAENLQEEVPEIYIAWLSEIILHTDKLKGFAPDDRGAMQYAGGGMSYAWLEK